MKYKIVVMCGALLFGWSCANRAGEDGSPKMVLSPLQETIEIQDISEYIDEISFVQIAEDERLMTVGISKALLDGDWNIHILDFQGSIVSIGRDGSDWGTVANKGGAGNEYVNASDIALTEDGNILVLDSPSVKSFSLATHELVETVEIGADNLLYRIDPTGKEASPE